jgi:ELWxxDGT repeat protein
MKKIVALLFFALTAHAQYEFPTGNSGVAYSARYAVLGEHAYFVATGDLWRTDGTNTVRFADFEAEIMNPVALRGKIVFFVQSELWETDGQTTSLVLAFDGTEISGGTTPDGETLWFTMRQNGRTYLWRSDGTGGGTAAVAQLPSFGVDLRAADGLLFFRTDDGSLWRSDGTPTGTFVVRKPVSSSTMFATFRNVALVQNYREDGQLWRSDGTLEGTYPLRDATLLDRLFAKTSEATYFYEYRQLVQTDGTVAGTTVLPTEVSVQALAVLNDRLYAIAHDGIWILAGTKLVRVAGVASSLSVSPYTTVVAGNAIWFQAYRAGLWRFDGKTMTLVHNFDDGFISGITSLGEHTLFFADDALRGREPWITDGTPAGTRMLANTIPEGTLHGQVVDAHGKPIPNASVVLYVRPLTPAPSWIEFQSRGYTTDAYGRFSIEGLRDATYYLHVRASGYTQAWWRGIECTACSPAMTTSIVVRAGAESSGYDVVLRALGVIRGRVTDDTGKPLPYAQVTAICERRYFSTSANVQGAYELELPPERACIVSTHLKHYASASANVRVASGEVRDGVDFAVKPNGSIGGRLIDAITGEPITIYALVTARNHDSGEVLQGTTVAGGYTITLRDGQWEVTIDPQDGTYAKVTLLALVSATPGEITAGYDIMLMPAGARIGGRVIDAASGAGLGGIEVRVFRGETLVASLFTNADGTFVTRPDLPPGTYVVRLQASSTRPGLVSQPIAVTGTDVIRDIDFTLGRYPTISGTIVDAVTREPLRNVRVGDVVTDAHGRYTTVAFDGVITATKLGWAPASREIHVDAADIHADFALTPECKVTPATTHAVGSKITIPLNGDCTVCASTTSPFIRFERACVKDVLTIYVEERRSGVVALPGILITVAQ